MVNIEDIFLSILGFQNEFPPAVPSRTVVAFDIDGKGCTPNQVVNIGDAFLAILAFQGEMFNPDVVMSSPLCSLPCP